MTRAGARSARIVADANEGWTAEIHAGLAPYLARLGVAPVEQPLPAGADDSLAEIAHPVPVCADESSHDRASRAEGSAIMVGCMVGSSLAMAPAFLVAQGAEIVDLDRPLLLARDRDIPVRNQGSEMQVPRPALRSRAPPSVQGGGAAPAPPSISQQKKIVKGA